MNSLTYQRVSVKATDRDTGRQRPAEERGARYRRVQFRPPAIELTSRTFHMRHTYIHTSTSVSQCRIYGLEKRNAIQTHPREYTHTQTHAHVRKQGRFKEGKKKRTLQMQPHFSRDELAAFLTLHALQQHHFQPLQSVHHFSSSSSSCCRPPYLANPNSGALKTKNIP